jgi:glutathione-regulated potassium-efflux system ancillary protein KefF
MLVSPTPKDHAMAHVLVLCAHPDLRQSRVNRALLAAAREVAASSTEGHVIEVRDLYALYPDYVIDVQTEQQHAARADLIVWQHPVHWYAMPPLMKLWLDEVLALGWAYGNGGTALRGKDLWLVLSTGGAADAYRPDGYNRYFFDAFIPPYEQTAALCGLRFLPPLVMHGAHAASKDAVAAHADNYRQHLLSYPEWPEMAEVEDCAACVLPEGERPSEATTAQEETVP